MMAQHPSETTMAALPQEDDTLSDLLLYWEEEYEKGNSISPSQLCDKHPHLLDKVQKAIEALKAGIWNHKLEQDPQKDSTHDFYQYLQLQTVLKDRFRIEEILGQGSQGIVYKALDLKLDRYVAIKSSRKIANLQPQEKELLLEEAKKIAKLKHPGIVTVFDILEFKDTFLFVSELLEGGDLAKAIHSNRLSLDQKLGILKEVALALDHAHNLGIVHRDLKPSNILLDHGLRPRICDFGISISRDNDAVLDKTGAVGFLTPELLNGATPSIASDIWSLGVVLFETLTQELPFDCPSTGKLIENILHAPPRLLVDRQPDLPKSLDVLVQDCLQKLPEDRLPTAQDFSRRIADIMQADKNRFSRKRLAYAGAGFLALVLVISGTLWSILGSKKPSDMEKIRSKRPMELTSQNLEQLNQQLNSLDYWVSPKKENWSQKPDGTFLGDGVGTLVFKEPLQDVFLLKFELTVLEGIRPRVLLNWSRGGGHILKLITFGNEGFTRKIGIHGSGKTSEFENFYPYSLNQKLNCAISLNNGYFEAHVNNQLISKGSYRRANNSNLVLGLSTGDNSSPGKMEFAHFELIFMDSESK